MKTQRKIQKIGIIGRHTEGLRRYFGWPSVCVDENGVIYAIVSRRMLHVDPFGQVCLYRSTDNGNTWSEPQVVVDDAMDDRDAGICYLGGGKMVMSYFTHSAFKYYKGQVYSWWLNSVGTLCTEEEKQKVFDTWEAMPEDAKWGGSYVRVSDDYGATWSDDIHVPLSAPHGPNVMKDGSLLYVGNSHDLEAYRKLTGDMTPYHGWGAISAIESKDGGRTWVKKSDLPMPPEWTENPGGNVEFCEAHVAQLKSGMLIAVLRPEVTTELFRRSEFEQVYICHSQNGGASWSMPKHLTNVDGQNVIGCPPHIMETSDGAVIISYSRRVAPCGIRAIVSYDGGYNWGEEIVLAQNWNPEDGDLGYPATAELPDGSLITVSYHKYLDDRFPSFMYTKWNHRKV